MQPSLFPDDIVRLAVRTLEAFRARQWRLGTVESCTGGLLAGVLTEIPGSSDVVVGGFVTYANSAKMRLVGVPEATLKAHGAVSQETAEAMARGGLLALGDADVVVSVTGVAGPGGGSVAKPVGLVYMGLARRAGKAGVAPVVGVTRHDFGTAAGTSQADLSVNGSDPVRTAIRLATARVALEALLAAASR